MDVLAAMRQWVSVRSYENRPVEPVLLERLLGLASAAAHLTEVPPRIVLAMRNPLPISKGGHLRRGAD